MSEKKRELCAVSRRGFLKTSVKTLSAVAGGPVLACCGGGGGHDVSSPAPVASSAVLTPPAQAANYKLAWHDEFEGNNLGSGWSVGTAVRDNATQSANAISVSNSILTISTYTDPATGTHHTGFLNTRALHEFTYGYIEARLRFISRPGQWSAFWLQSSNNKAYTPPNPAAGVEIDIIEHRAMTAAGADISNKLVSNLHWNGYISGQHQTTGSGLKSLPAGQAFSDWHTLGLLWTATGYTVYLDEAPVWTTTTAVSQANEYLLLTSEIRNNDWAGNIPAGGYGALGASTNPVMQVDWVRVWQA